MVYTDIRFCQKTYLSAIAEILLWFTPVARPYRVGNVSAIAEILLWLTPNAVSGLKTCQSAIAEILLWLTPFACKSNDFQSFMQVFGDIFTPNTVFQP